MNPTVGVVGASARAAVHSLARAGLSAWAVDLFADRDLARVAPCAACPPDRYPAALPELARQFPPGPVLYTGGLENYPAVVAELAADRELWGNRPEVLERVRDPFQLFPALAATGFAVPALVPPGEPCPTTGRWLRKPLRSSGGLGVRPATPGEPASESHYFQEFIDGVSMSALFISDPAEPDSTYVTCLDGVTQQLVGEPWLHSRPFAYCGNIGPIELPQQIEANCWVAGLLLSREMGLRGTWGLDFIWRGDNLYPVEVNPRYTAALEVLELGARFAAMWSHWQVFTGSRALVKKKTAQRYDTSVGKAIYYTPHAIRFPEAGPWDADLAGPFDPWRLPAFADIPAPGAAVEEGHPVLTIFVTGSSPVDCRERLQSRAAELDRLFAEARA
jgi:predicted ATP-grasp superfamily ATP-dependent carboligase